MTNDDIISGNDDSIYGLIFPRELMNIDKLEAELEKDIDDFLNKFGRNFVFKNSTSKDLYRSPISYLKETDKEYLMNVEIPGVQKENIKLNINGGRLELIAESKTENETEKSLSKFRFYRTLPNNIDKTNITSEYKDGILEVKLPKIEYKAPEKLEIKIN